MNETTRRGFIHTLALGGAGLAAAAQVPALAAPAIPDVSFVDPELRPFASQVLQFQAASPPLSTATLGALRKVTWGAPPPQPTPAFRKQLIPGLAGQPEVTAYVINASPGAARPAILHTHGGGFVSGSAEIMISALQPIAVALDCVIVTVEYRLAPETPFAGSIEDNYAALKWLYTQAESLGVDRKRIAVMGESAGGGHAALLAITARDRGEVPLAFQALIYPMLDDRTGSAIMPPAPIGSVLWTAAMNRFGWASFLGQAPGTASVPVRAVPARQPSLKGLPPTFIGVGAIDLFVDEDVAYANRLIDSGVPTELLVVPGAFHGFDGIGAATSPAKAFTAAKLAALRRAFSAPA